MGFNYKKYTFLIIFILLTPILASVISSFFRVDIKESFECWCRSEDGTQSVSSVPAHTELVSTPVTLSTVKQIIKPLPTFGSPLSYTLSFWVKIPDMAPGWRNIIRFGPDDTKTRLPAVYIWPTSLNLHCRHGTSANFNEGIDAIPGVTANVWAHFAVTVSGRIMSSYINGVAGPTYTATADYQVSTDQVYIPGDPSTYVDPAHLISVGYVWFFPLALVASDIAKVYAAAHVGAQ
jgi:hypothetical protein